MPYLAGSLTGSGPAVMAAKLQRILQVRFSMGTRDASSHLAVFIRERIDEIVRTWTAFAESIPVMQGCPLVDQEDHARQLLLAMADDIDRPQTEDTRQRKSLGRQTPHGAGGADLDSSSGEHGKMRFGQGMSAPEVFSEYRALRAAVLRLWSATFAGDRSVALDELTRFNEAIDQALSISLLSYVTEQDKKIKRLDQVLSTIPDYACVLGLDGRLLYANRALADYFRRPPERLAGMSLEELGVVPPKHLADEFARVVSGGALVQSETLTELDSGQSVFYEYVLAPVFDSQGKVEAVTGTARDITERKLHDREVWRKANFDSLTELPNRHLFRDRLDHEVRHAERTGACVALLFIDLDQFKAVNDALGHPAGDRLLQQTAQRILACTRAEDTVARLGGDEFTVILAGLQHTEGVQAVAQKIITRLAESFELEGERVHVSASIGITLYPRDAKSPDDLIRNADQAMYVAKQAGRSRFRFFADDIQQAVAARVRLVAELRQGVAGHEFMVYFQPIIDMKTGHVEKAEALVRWNHPLHGVLLPSAFITAAEDAGLVAEIDNLVLAEVTRRAAEWRAYRQLQISINQSLMGLLEANNAAWRVGALGALTAPRDSLAIEITESVLLQSSSAVLARIAELRASGVQIILDDFGTSCSALAHLARFEVDSLKIDQRFVRELISNSVCRAVARAIITLAHELGLVVIAEGVENTEQRDWLRAADCDFAQGFLYAEALPADAFARLLVQQPDTQPLQPY